MKKNHIFVLILVFLLSLSPMLSGKDKGIELSVRGGVNFFKLSFKDGEVIPLPRHEGKLAYSLGAGIQFGVFKNLSLEVDVLYKTTTSELVEFSGIQWGDTYYKLNYLAFPVMVQYKIPLSTSSIFVSLGLETGFLLKSQIEDKTGSMVIEKIENIKDTNSQFLSGLGIRYKCFSFEVRYGLGLSNLNRERNDLTIKSRGVEFLAAVHF
jgi:hypothetical protein